MESVALTAAIFLVACAGGGIFCGIGWLLDLLARQSETVRAVTTGVIVFWIAVLFVHSARRIANAESCGSSEGSKQ